MSYEDEKNKEKDEKTLELRVGKVARHEKECVR